MREYVAIPENILADPTSLRSWVAEAFQFAASMPAKQPKKRKPKKRKPKKAKTG